MWVHSDLKGILGRVRVHLGDSIVMHVGIDGELLDPGGDEESSGVSSDDLHLQHAVHEGDPVVDPGETAAGTLDVAAENAAEEATGERGIVSKVFLIILIR